MRTDTAGLHTAELHPTDSQQLVRCQNAYNDTALMWFIHDVPAQGTRFKRNQTDHEFMTTGLVPPYYASAC